METSTEASLKTKNMPQTLSLLPLNELSTHICVLSVQLSSQPFISPFTFHLHSLAKERKRRG
jgi:hypothetical protein